MDRQNKATWLKGHMSYTSAFGMKKKHLWDHKVTSRVNYKHNMARKFKLLIENRLMIQEAYITAEWALN